MEDNRVSTGNGNGKGEMPSLDGKVCEVGPGATQPRHREWKWENTKLIEESGIPYKSSNNGESLLFREPYMPKVDFYPSTGRWRVAGQDRTYRGMAKAFLAWYRKHRHSFLEGS